MVGKSVTVTCSFVYNLGYQQASRASYELRPANSQPTDQLESNGHQVYFDSIRFKFRRASVPVNRAIQKRSCKPDKWTSVYNRLWDIQPLSFSLIQHIHVLMVLLYIWLVLTAYIIEKNVFGQKRLAPVDGSPKDVFSRTSKQNNLI